MPRSYTQRHAKRRPVNQQSKALEGSALNDAIKSVRLQIEQEKLYLLKAKTATLKTVDKAPDGAGLESRLKGYVPSAKELKYLRKQLEQRLATLSLNDCGALVRMLAHRRENGCNDIELLERELRLHKAARDARIAEKRSAYGSREP